MPDWHSSNLRSSAHVLHTTTNTIPTRSSINTSIRASRLRATSTISWSLWTSSRWINLRFPPQHDILRQIRASTQASSSCDARKTARFIYQVRVSRALKLPRFHSQRTSIITSAVHRWNVFALRCCEFLFSLVQSARTRFSKNPIR